MEHFIIIARITRVRMKAMKITATALLAIALVLVLLVAGCTQSSSSLSTAPATSASTPNGTVGILETAGVGPMPPLLATNQVDGYIAWQPVVEAGMESNIGQIAVYSKDLPPPVSGATTRRTSLSSEKTSMPRTLILSTISLRSISQPPSISMTTPRSQPGLLLTGLPVNRISPTEM